MRVRQPFVYILASGCTGTLYVGVTSDLLSRIVQHREGMTPGFATAHSVKRLVWFERHDTMPSAILAEKRLKRWRRDRKKNLIERDNPRWEDLAVQLGLPPLR
ncbi:MAG: GIY-YIG nuclease family protein [Sphingomonas sp.]|nr:MAG: GIY-YIG nuclease family protein [Sphingomonas sp.]